MLSTAIVETFSLQMREYVFPGHIHAEKWYSIFKDHITLEDYEIHDGMGLELYYN